MTIRYTNVIITMNSVIILGIMILMNVIFIWMFLKKMESSDASHAYLDTMKNFYLAVIPVIVIAIVFTLDKNIAISSIGMIAFWGILINAIYNWIFTRTAFLNMKK